MINATEIKELTFKIQAFEEAADKQESKEMLNFYGWLKDFKGSTYLKGLRREAKTLTNKIVKIAKKADAAEWDAMIKAQNICPEIYSHEAITEY